MSLLRKALWPTAIALGFLVFLGAIGQGNVVKTASADTGDICKIATTATVVDGDFYMSVDQTVLFAAIIEVEDFDEDLSVYDASVDLDDGGSAGDSDITSRAIEDGDFWEYDDGINTDFLNEVGIVDPSEKSSNFDVGDLEDGLDAAFPGWDKALGASIGIPGGIAIGDNICGDNAARIASDLLKALEEDIAECIDDDDCDDDWTEANLVSDLTWPLEVGISPGDIAKWLADWIIAKGGFDVTAEDDQCEEISGDLQDYLNLKGVSPGIAEDIGDDVEDLCNGYFGADYSYWYWPEDFSLGIDGWVIVDVTCVEAGVFELSFSIHGENEDAQNITVTCVGEVDDMTLTSYPNKVEIVPAQGSVSYSLIVASLFDEDGDFPLASAISVDFKTSKCVFLDEDGVKAADFHGAGKIADLFDDLNVNDPATAKAINDYLKAIEEDPDDDSNKVAAFNATADAGTKVLSSIDEGDALAVIILDCTDASTVPGVATITAEIDQAGKDIIKSTTVTVVGPPAAPVAVAADQTSVICGDRIAITVSVKDSAGQAVSDHTLVEAVTTFGGILGGTGAVAGNLGFVVPVSSTLSETFNGVATFYLLTSNTHVGAYDVTVSTGGGGSVTVALGGFFSTPVQVGRVSASCTLPVVAPVVVATVTAPRTGQGIVPPNTGDAGLAASSESGLSLLVIAGVVAFALAGVASLKFARR